MFKAAKTWSFLESWLDGLLICNKCYFFFGNLAFKYNTSQGRSIVRFLMCISISSQGLEKSNKEIYINGVFAFYFFPV